MGRKIEELESVRGIAALLVVFYHLPKWNPIIDFGFLNSCYLMVDLFFVLSGFVIYNSYSTNIGSTRDLWRFQYLRLMRLYPVHLLFLLVFLGIEFSKVIAQARFGINSPNTSPFTINNASAFLQNLLLVQSVIPDQPMTFNYPSWSISVEFWTYLVFGLTVLLIKRGRSRVLAFLLLSVPAILLLATDQNLGLQNLLRCLAGFFLGSLTAHFIAQKKVQASLPAWVLPVVVVAFVLLLQTRDSAPDVPDIRVYPLAVMIVMAIVLGKDGWVRRALRSRPLIWLGGISYSLYMAHASIEWAANQVVRVVMKRPEAISAHGSSVPQLTATETLMALGLIVIVVLLVSQLVFVWVEDPVRRWSRRVIGKAPIPSPRQATRLPDPGMAL